MNARYGVHDERRSRDLDVFFRGVFLGASVVGDHDLARRSPFSLWIDFLLRRVGLRKAGEAFRADPASLLLAIRSRRTGGTLFCIVGLTHQCYLRKDRSQEPARYARETERSRVTAGLLEGLTTDLTLVILSALLFRDRLTAGQRTLNPLIMVRIHVSEPTKHHP